MKFKDLWIKPSLEGSEGEETPRTNDSGGAAMPSPPPVQVDDSTSGPFLAQLEEALEKANLPSQQDYLDFAKALKNMANLPMDEATKYRAAFATLQSFGCELAQLLDSFDYYNGIIDGERDKFEEALRARVNETVGDKESQVKKLTGENQEDSAEIEKLTARITANQQEITRLQNELADISAKLKRQENGFLAAFTMLKQRLQTDAGKIRSYLGPVAPAGPSRKS
jgi:chromosome segregation ATPase